MRAHSRAGESSASTSEIITLVSPCHYRPRPRRLVNRPCNSARGICRPDRTASLHPRDFESDRYLCYKADRAGDGVPVRRGAPLREIAAARPGRKSGPTERTGDDVGAVREYNLPLSECDGVRTYVSAGRKKEYGIKARAGSAGRAS